MRAEERARFETGNVDSSGATDEMRRRSEEELGGGEALDNLHGSAAKRTLPQRVSGQRGRGGASFRLRGVADFAGLCRILPRELVDLG